MLLLFLNKSLETGRCLAYIYIYTYICVWVYLYYIPKSLLTPSTSIIYGVESVWKTLKPHTRFTSAGQAVQVRNSTAELFVVK